MTAYISHWWQTSIWFSQFYKRCHALRWHGMVGQLSSNFSSNKIIARSEPGLGGVFPVSYLGCSLPRSTWRACRTWAWCGSTGRSPPRWGPRWRAPQYRPTAETGSGGSRTPPPAGDTGGTRDVTTREQVSAGPRVHRRRVTQTLGLFGRLLWVCAYPPHVERFWHRSVLCTVWRDVVFYHRKVFPTVTNACFWLESIRWLSILSNNVWVATFLSERCRQCLLINSNKWCRFVQYNTDLMCNDFFFLLIRPPSITFMLVISRILR